MHYYDCYDKSEDNGASMVDDWSYVVLTLISEAARCREHLNDAYKAEKEEYHPQYLVAFEYITDLH